MYYCIIIIVYYRLSVADNFINSYYWHDHLIFYDIIINKSYATLSIWQLSDMLLKNEYTKQGNRLTYSSTECLVYCSDETIKSVGIWTNVYALSAIIMSLVTIRPIKLVVVGDHTVGKTCLLTSFATNQFPTDFVPAVFGCWMSNTIEIDGQLSSLIPWDTPGMQFEPLKFNLWSYTEISSSIHHYYRAVWLWST